MIRVRDVLNALDRITKGRCVKDISDFSTDKNPWVVMKSSGIPGKSCLETPGLVWGDPEKCVRKAAVCMTLTESVIELAGSTGVDAIISHHPVCEAANSGGVFLSSYLDLYNLAYFEVHEAFHGLHPGIPWLHGHMPVFTSTNYGGITGNVVNVGNTVDEVKTLGQLLDRLNRLIDLGIDCRMLAMERKIRDCCEIQETAITARGKILVGERCSPVRQIIHLHPHCSITSEHLLQLKEQFPKADTVVASISHVDADSELVKTARQAGMNFVCGNSHALEIFENGVPLAYALRGLLPDLEIVIFRERQISTPLDAFGSPEIRDYGRWIANEYLPKRDRFRQ